MSFNVLDFALGALAGMALMNVLRDFIDRRLRRVGEGGR